MAIDKKANDSNVKSINTTIAGFHVSSELGVNVATADLLEELTRQLPYWNEDEENPKRDAIEGLPSLAGMWARMFLKIEDGFHKARILGSEDDADPHEILREQSLYIALAVHEYVSAAIVSTNVDTVTSGVASPIDAVNTMSGPTTGTGVGTGSGNLS